MKKMILILVMTFLLISGSCQVALAYDVHYSHRHVTLFDKYGNVTGEIRPIGNLSIQTDKYGNVQKEYKQIGNMIYVYDKNGNCIGSYRK